MRTRPAATDLAWWRPDGKDPAEDGWGNPPPPGLALWPLPTTP